MQHRSVLYEKKGPVARITLNRAQASNTLNPPMAQELVSLCGDILEDDEIRVAIVTGAGNEAFSRGLDLSQYPAAEDLAAVQDAARSVAAVARLKVPVIAALNGDALGWGLELALGCDIRIAAESARFGLPQVTYGLLPWAGGTQRLPRMVGRGKALHMILTGEFIDATEAHRMGLVTSVVPLSALGEAADELAQRLAGGAPIALRYIKEAVQKGLDLTLDQGMGLEADLSVILQTTKDRAEGLKAFFEKRRPQFHGE